MHSIYLLLLTLLAGCLHSTSAWTYDHIEDWSETCHTGKSQSPIDLVNKISVDFEAPPFHFVNYKKDYLGKLKNNGRSVVMKLAEEKGKPQVTGGDLNGTYILDHMHFHWGSEHTIDGKRFPVEIHAVHYNSKYNGIPDAVKVPNGIAVFSILFELSPDDVEEVDIITNIMDSMIDKKGVEFNASNAIRPKDYFPSDTAGYFRYAGSLTTPNCEEVVIWTVFTNKLTLSQRQVDYFKMIEQHTYRPAQELNGRTIYLKRSPLNSSKEKLSVPVLLLIISVSFSKLFC